MKLAKETRPITSGQSDVGKVLVEALPWIRSITGETIVIKYGGSAMVDAELRAKVMSDVILLKIIGMNPIIVHGGGAAISHAMDELHMPVKFLHGMRVTSDAAMDVVREVLIGKVNQDLVRDLNRHGNLAVGVSGIDAGTIMAEQLSADLGRVGKVTAVNPGLINGLIADAYIPVVASVGMGQDGSYYNINADVAAGEVAAAVRVHRLVFLTDVDGVYRDFSDKSSLISRLSGADAQRLIDINDVDAGMIPKIQTCIRALKSGVPHVHIINGKKPHELLLELLTDEGAGTMFYREGDDATYETHSLGKFASKLVENADDREVR